MEAGQRLFIQPIVELATGRHAAAELLMRWHDPVRGLLAPSDFIPAAERSGAIHELGRWILDEAAALAADAGPQRLDWVSVNVSPWQLLRFEFPAAVARALARVGRPGALVLELTENLRDFDLAEIGAALTGLREVGARIALDDCDGSDHSWDVLARLPVPDLIKIDRQVVHGRNEPVLRRFAAWAQRAGVEVVAEGIEQQAQADLARRLGYRYGQGFLFAYPRPAALAEGS